MCTVSFISLNNKFVITSNRDENILRPVAFAPQEEIINGCKIIYPKDPKAGGTWFAINQSGAVAVLLNGAFEKHIPLNNYSKSRGLILLEVISKITPLLYFEKLDYEINVIDNMGFSGYFLIVQDFINWAKSKDIPVE